ncbi:Protein FAM19A5 [Nibea albiflora]|uniref:Protein FAM19A5 n=1 Tax=Nibea albiflora TaxID=240163 RepID=A0ACB7EUU6_NIBAL|nr:Protein FAM19A5 [Nibea albiflora]
MQLLRVAWALTGAAICCFLILLIHSRLLKEGQLAAGTCEIVTLDRDSSQPRRTIARQTARCACKKGQIAGTTRARPACVDASQGTCHRVFLSHDVAAALWREARLSAQVKAG